MRNASRILFLALVLWGWQLCTAAEPPSLADAMQERGALGSALASADDEVPAEESHTDFNLGIALLVVVALALLRSAPGLKQRFGHLLPKAEESDEVTAKVLEEPTVAAFFAALNSGPVTPAFSAAASSDPIGAFYDLAARYLADLRRLFSEIGRTPDDAGRQAKLIEAFHRIGTLRERAEMPELLPIWQVAFAFEELLKQLQRKRSDLTPSVLRTSAGALDLLRDLCREHGRSDLLSNPPVRLLAVDDDAICRHAVCVALKKAFGTPDLAADGHTALALAAQHAYDAIFVDVEMPGMNGYELCGKIRETPKNRTAPVVFVTSHDQLGSRAKAALVGAQDFIAKPFLVFEITVKVLTMVLRARLGSTAPPAPASEPGTASSSTAIPSSGTAASREIAPAVPSGSVSGADPAPPNLCPSDSAGGAVMPPAGSPSSAASSSEAATSGGRGPGSLSARSQPVRSALADAFFAQAPARIAELRRLLASAGEARSEALPDLMADLYLDAHRFCTDARGAELNAALRLASALEAMLKKLFDRPNLCTHSTLDAAAGALDVFDELCRARLDPDLAEPAPRILVVDDDAVAGRAIAISLQLAFGRPDKADSGETAVVLAGTKEYDLIFLDVQMAGMDGFAACSRIHTTVMNRFTPVVFVTGQSDTASRAQAVHAGGCGFIPKPVLASQITLISLTYILKARLGGQMPTLKNLADSTGTAPESASRKAAGRKKRASSGGAPVGG